MRSQLLAALVCLMGIPGAVVAQTNNLPIDSQQPSAESILAAPPTADAPAPSPASRPPSILVTEAPAPATSPAAAPAAPNRATSAEANVRRPAPARRTVPARAPGPAASRTPNPGNPTAALAPIGDAKTADVVRLVLILGLLAILPALLICMTSFVRLIIVLAMIRHAFGMPETPPNAVLISLALFLTAFAMLPTLTAINEGALQPFMAGTLAVSDAIARGSAPARDFMLRQVHDRDIKAIYDISRKPLPSRAADVELMQLVPAFMLNELRAAFRIGFVILLPFLLIDLVVSSVLLALGMIMVPPSTISLPLKVLMFVLVDGWSLVLQGVLASFR